MQRISFDSGGNMLVGSLYLADKSAPTLLLLHGMSFYSFEYEILAPLLFKKGYNCLSFDFRGHGGSEGKRGDWKLEELAGDVACALDFLEGEVKGPIGVFGNSLGSAAGVYAAARDKRIRSVVCCNTPTKPSAALYTPFRKVLLFLMKQVSRFWNFRFNISPFIPTSLVFSDDKLIERIDNDPKIYEARRFTAAAYSEMVSWDVSEEVKKVTVPIRILHGTRDRLQPVSQSVLLFEAANEPKQLKLLDAGHVPTLENPQELLNCIYPLSFS